MNERLKKVTTVVKEKWTGFTTPIKVMLISIPFVIIAIIILLAILLNHKDSSILYSNLSTDEAIQIGAAIEALGVDSKDIQISGGTIKVPSDKQDELRMKLAVQGYPKTSTNYDIWNSGINLWTTQGQMNEVARQQREANLAVTIAKLDAVMTCTANLDIPETNEYTINTNKKLPTCSLTLRLNGDEELTNNEVRAIYGIASKAVEGLTIENISIVDTKGRPYDYISKEEEDAEGHDPSGVPVAKRRYEFEHAIQSAALEDIREFLEPIYGSNGYSASVNVRVNFDGETIEDMHYYPDDEENHTGVKHEQDIVNTRTDLEGYQDLIGETPNADLSPNYPTYIGGEDGSGYYFYKNQVRYDVSYVKKNIIKDGYSLDNVSVAVAVNTDSLTEADRQKIISTVAMAAGTTIDKVDVLDTPFVIPSNRGGSSSSQIIATRPGDPYRNMLLWLVIALGIILVILLIASLFVSKSRKKKINKRRELAYAAAQAAAESNVAFENSQPEEVDFNIASLTEEAGRESRETILKREIAEFARTSPDIVASIIRNMLRDE